MRVLRSTSIWATSLLYIVIILIQANQVSLQSIRSPFSSTTANSNSAVEKCNRNFSQLWPSNPPGPTLVLGFLMTMIGDVTERLGLKIPGILSKSVLDVNRMHILPKNYTLQIQIRDTKGDEVLSTKYVTELVCQDIHAFIGPEHTCWVEATIAEANNIPMISYACTDKKASQRKTFARTNPSEKRLLLATVETLHYFNWTRFTIVYDKDMQVMADSLENLSIQHKLKLNDVVSYNGQDDFPSLFLKTMNKTRIYVLLGHRSDVPNALLAMTFRGLFKVEKKEYMLLFVETEEFFHKDWSTYLFRPEGRMELRNSNHSLEDELETYARSFMVVANTLPEISGTIDAIDNITREFNKKEPFCLTSNVQKALFRGNTGGRLLPITTQHVPFLTSSYLYDAVKIYARAVRNLYDEMVRAGTREEEIDVSQIGRNGTAIAQQLTNMTFESILGYNVTMGENRESEGRYSVYYFTASEKCSDSTHQSDLRTNSHCLIKLSDFVRDKPISTNVTIDIVAMPRCGYDNKGCDEEGAEPRRILLIILIVTVILVAFISVQMYRHWLYEQEISGLQWRIEKKELSEISHMPISNSRCSLASCVSQELAAQMFYNPVADYRGAYVCLKGICHRRQELSRETMKRMRSMREIKHRNVCPFIGAYVEVSKLTLVTEYCNRGSLEDILENDDIKLDKLFIASLVQDLLRAMVFLHASFGAHGNFKSTNCVITGRWVLQVTDYDLQEIRNEEYTCLTEYDTREFTELGKKFLKRQLWRSPELLRLGPEEPGTKESDVYAFGIILHEIIARQGPFSISGGEAPDIFTIVDEVKKGAMASGLPRRPCLEDLHDMPFGSDRDVVDSMKMSWQEEKDKRPDFKALMVKLKKLKKSGNLMDHMVTLLEEHNKNLEGLVHSKTQELRDEKRRTEDLLHRMLPQTVVVSLLNNMYVEPQSYDAVTIYFSDIVGFTALSAESTPYEVVSFLNDLYLEFDTIIACFDVYKVETIGDAYLVVSGLPKRNEGRHAGEIASMALAILDKTTTFKIKHKPHQQLKLRIGLHTGPVIAGLVGRTMPRYCMFGDTVNTASRMESTGEPLRIHMSGQCKEALDALGGYQIEERGLTHMKGKGNVLTYWLISAAEKAIQPREQPDLPMPFFQRFDEFDHERFRKRSPRLSHDGRHFGSSPGSKTPTPSMTRAKHLSLKNFDIDDENLQKAVIQSNLWKALSRSVGENDESISTAKEVLRPDRLMPTHQWRRLSASLRANSLECSTKGGLLSPPVTKNCAKSPSRTPSNGSIRESHSLDRFPAPVQVEIPPSPTKQSPSSSDPNIIPSEIIHDEAPKVNFSPNTKIKDEDGNEAETELDNEFEPMLRTEDEIYSPATTNKMKSFFNAFRAKSKKEPHTKLALNGLQSESHV